MTHGLDTSFLVAVEVGSHEEHGKTRIRFQKLLKAGDTFSLAPQILAEFIHVVTDSRRFSSPLTLEQAVERAEIWTVPPRDEFPVDSPPKSISKIEAESELHGQGYANGRTKAWTEQRNGLQETAP